MPSPREGLAVAVVNGILYAIGGVFNGTYLSTVEAYDPVTDSWSTKSAMPTPRLSPAASVVDGIIYVAGGANASGSIGTTEAYNPATDTWSTKALMPTARYFLGAGSLNELVYAVGGITTGHNTVSATEAYDYSTDTWTEVAAMPTSRVPSVGIINGVLYAVGGYDYNAGVALHTNEAFTPRVPGVALLSGGNNFTGDQTVNGLVSATSFVGSGASLTGVDAATLGGVAPANYARVDIGNSFSGNQNVNGNLSISGNSSTGGSVTIGGGTAITKHLSALFNPSIAPLKPASCATVSFILSGASDGDTLALGVPNARMTGGTGVILNYFAWVSTANMVTIQACNVGASPQKTAGLGAFRVDVWKH